jgi:NAD(P)-dependent dehydrogenase (short-subunit alcohol dehydrogenase family)
MNGRSSSTRTTHDIRVLALAPTLIATEGVEEAQADLRRLTGSEDPNRAFSEMLPLGRVGIPDDVARVALFCASDLSILMTGDTLLIDAGNPTL